MAGEQLLEAAGQNFKQAGDTAIQSGEAQTKKEEVQQQPGTQAGKNINDLVTTAMGDKARMKEIQEKSAGDIKLELLKGKMGETQFPPELAIQMAKDFKDPTILQLANHPMNNKLMGAFVAEKYKAHARQSQPRFSGNMMITTDPDGNEVMTDMTKFGFHYRPTSGGEKPETAEDKARATRMKAFLDDQKVMSNAAGWAQLQATNPKLAAEIEDRHQQGADQYAKDSAVKDKNPDSSGDGAPASSGQVMDTQNDSLFDFSGK